MTTATLTTCRKCHATLTEYDARCFQGHCKACYHGTPLGEGEDNGMTPCDDCEAEIADETYELNDGRCDACRLTWTANHFTCTNCEEELENEDRSTACKTRCQSCQATIEEEQAAERLETAKDEARELLEALLDGDQI